MGGNLFWGMRFAPFSHKTALDRQLVLSRLFRVKTAQSHTAITSMVASLRSQILRIVVAKATNLKKFVIARFGYAESKQSKQNTIRTKCESLQKFLLLFAFAKSRISLPLRHCEANHRFAEAIHKDKSIK